MKLARTLWILFGLGAVVVLWVGLPGDSRGPRRGESPESGPAALSKVSPALRSTEELPLSNLDRIPIPVAPATPADKARESILGTVLNDAGDPIAASVSVLVGSDGDPTEFEGSSEEESGRFQIDLPTLHQHLRLKIVADGYAPFSMTHAPPFPTRPFDVGEIVLGRGHTLRGLVLDAHEAPVAGARILVVRHHRKASRYPRRGHYDLIAVSGEDGAFLSSPIGPGSWDLEVRHRAHATLRTTFSVREAADGEGLVFRMPEGVTIHGTTSGDLAIPSGLSAFLERRERFLRIATTTCDASGAFSFGLFPAAEARELQVRVGWNRGPGRIVGTLGGPEPVPDDGYVSVELKAASLSLGVRDATTGEPLGEFSATVEYWGPSSSYGGKAWEARLQPEGTATGRYTAIGVPIQAAHEVVGLRIEKAGYATLRQMGWSLTGAARTDLGWFELQRMPFREIVVLDGKTRRPVADGIIRMVSERDPVNVGVQHQQEYAEKSFSSAEPTESTARTDADGRGRIHVLSTERSVVFVEHPDHSLSSPQVVDPGVNSELIFLMEPGSSIVVTVTTTDGAPVGGVRVLIQRSTAPWPKSLHIEEPFRISRISDPEGRVAFGRLVAGRYDIHVPAVEGAEPGHVVELLSARAETHAVNVRFPTLAEVSGLVTERGRPLTSARVRIQRRGQDVDQTFSVNTLESGRWATSTDAGGRFLFAGVEEGLYEVAVSHVPLQLVQVSAPRTELRLDLGRATVRGKVLGPDREPVDGASVEAMDADARYFLSSESGEGIRQPGVGQRATEGLGAYELTELPVGQELVVRAWARGFAPWVSEPLLLSDGETRGLDIVLRRGAEVSVRVGPSYTVRFGTFAPYCVSIRPAHEANRRDWLTYDQAGTTRVRVAPGEWIVELIESLSGAIVGDRRISVEDGDSIQVELP